MAVTITAQDEELFVRCKTCGFPVASGLRRPVAGLETAEVVPRAHRCPRCGQAHAYAKLDYFHLTGSVIGSDP